MGLPSVARLFRRPPPRLAPADAYALWAESYPPVPHNALMRAEQAVMTRMIAAAAPRRALDVGTGTGRYLTVLAAAGARLIVGVDLAIEMLARQDGTRPRVRADACCLPFRRESFDLVTSSLMMGDVDDLEGWVREIARVLAPGGHAVYSDFHPSWTAARWQRTFRAQDGRTFQVPYHPHDIAAHVAALDRHGFDIRAIREPRIEGADAAGLRPRYRQLPVVIAFHAVKRRWQAPRAAAHRLAEVQAGTPGPPR